VVLFLGGGDRDIMFGRSDIDSLRYKAVFRETPSILPSFLEPLLLVRKGLHALSARLES
jgi:hypothetical protein